MKRKKAKMKFTESHEWVNVEGEIATVGITSYAQKEIGDIVYVELPEKGRIIKSGEDAVVLESTKAAADVYSPLTGEVVEINETLAEASEKINQDPQGTGWFFKIKLQDPSELDKLMDLDAYEAFVS